jgi:hypothetical protein
MRRCGVSEPGPPRLGEKVLGFRQWTLGTHGLRPLVASLPFTFSTKTVPTWFVERWQAALSSRRADERTATLLAIVHGSGERLRWFPT